MDGKEAMFPGAFNKPEEDCNCRCVALTRAKWALDEEELETLKKRAEFFGLDKSKEFEEYRGKYLRAAEQVKEEPKTQFVPAKTRGEAEEYAKRFAQSVSYDGMSVENANRVNQQLTVLMEKYPIRQLEEIRTGGTKGIMAANYHWLKINKGKLGAVMENDYKTFMANQEQVRENLRTIRERFAGRRMPPPIQKTVTKLENELQYNRWAIYADYTDKIGVTVTHEYGHIISDQYFGMINQEAANPNYVGNARIRRTLDKWNEIWQRAHSYGDIYKISQYGATDEREFFAECFAAREFGEKLPDYIEEFMGEVLKNGIL
jgi:hypothetical protein